MAEIRYNNSIRRSARAVLETPPSMAYLYERIGMTTVPDCAPNCNPLPDSGIYGILNTVTGKLYVGSTITMNGRQRDHVRELRLGIHKNVYLQAAYNKDGPEAFAWGCLEMVPCADLLAREAYWIEALQSADRAYGYNLGAASMGRLIASPETRAKLSAAIRQFASTPEYRAKMSAALKGRVYSDETLARMRTAAQARVANGLSDAELAKLARMRAARGPVTEATRAQMRASSRHQPHTPETRAHLSAAARARLAAHPMTPEHIEKIAAAHRGKTRPPPSAETRARLSEAARAQHARNRAARSAYKQSILEDFE